VIRRIDAIRARSKQTSGREINESIRHDRDHDLGREIPSVNDDSQ